MRSLLFKKISYLLRLSHWSKACFVLLGVLYAGKSEYWLSALGAAFAFCLVASAVYIYNDLQDLEEDRAHPIKSQRPLAEGSVSPIVAKRVLWVCLGAGILQGVFMSWVLLLILSIYLLINLFYNHGVRCVPLLDVICIASGFLLRVLAGTVGIGLPISWWLCVAATLLSLFIALCKRRLEMTMKQTIRTVLHRYSPQILDRLIVVVASGCFITYLLYTIYARSERAFFLGTLPFAALGLWRFAVLSLEQDPSTKPHNDDPIALFLSDALSRINGLFFIVFTLMAVMQ